MSYEITDALSNEPSLEKIGPTVMSAGGGGTIYSTCIAPTTLTLLGEQTDKQTNTREFLSPT